MCNLGSFREKKEDILSFIGALDNFNIIPTPPPHEIFIPVEA